MLCFADFSSKSKVMSNHAKFGSSSRIRGLAATLSYFQMLVSPWLTGQVSAVLSWVDNFIQSNFWHIYPHSVVLEAIFDFSCFSCLISSFWNTCFSPISTCFAILIKIASISTPTCSWRLLGWNWAGLLSSFYFHIFCFVHTVNHRSALSWRHICPGSKSAGHCSSCVWSASWLLLSCLSTTFDIWSISGFVSQT